MHRVVAPGVYTGRELPPCVNRPTADDPVPTNSLERMREAATR